MSFFGYSLLFGKKYERVCLYPVFLTSFILVARKHMIVFTSLGKSSHHSLMGTHFLFPQRISQHMYDIPNDYKCLLPNHLDVIDSDKPL